MIDKKINIDNKSQIVGLKTGGDINLNKSKSNDKINLIIRGSYVDDLNKVTTDVCKVLEKFMLKFAGPVMIPSRKKRFTLLRSPHIDKDSRQVIGIDERRRLIQLPKSQRAMSAIAGLSGIVDGNPYVSIQIKESGVKK